MAMNRREMLGSLIALAAAPFVARMANRATCEATVWEWKFETRRTPRFVLGAVGRVVNGWMLSAAAWEPPVDGVRGVTLRFVRRDAWEKYIDIASGRSMMIRLYRTMSFREQIALAWVRLWAKRKPLLDGPWRDVATRHEGIPGHA